MAVRVLHCKCICSAACEYHGMAYYVWHVSFGISPYVSVVPTSSSNNVYNTLHSVADIGIPKWWGFSRKCKDIYRYTQQYPYAEYVYWMRTREMTNTITILHIGTAMSIDVHFMPESIGAVFGGFNVGAVAEAATAGNTLQFPMLDWAFPLHVKHFRLCHSIRQTVSMTCDGWYVLV